MRVCVLCIYIDVLQICIYECKSNTNTYTVFLYNIYSMHMTMSIFVYSIYIISSFFANPLPPNAQEHQMVVRVFGLREGELNENDWKCILENHWRGFLFAQGHPESLPTKRSSVQKGHWEKKHSCKTAHWRGETTFVFEATERKKERRTGHI